MTEAYFSNDNRLYRADGMVTDEDIKNIHIWDVTGDNNDWFEVEAPCQMLQDLAVVSLIDVYEYELEQEYA